MLVFTLVGLTAGMFFINMCMPCLQLVLKSLEADLRKMMSPNTATNLRVRKSCNNTAALCLQIAKIPEQPAQQSLLYCMETVSDHMPLMSICAVISCARFSALIDYQVVCITTQNLLLMCHS